MAIFFNITPPTGLDAREWAKRMGGFYGFDYDGERCTSSVLAWPYNYAETEKEAVEVLSEALTADEIEFTTFDADPDIFGVDPRGDGLLQVRSPRRPG